jgi:glycosyltransferase involved in cell wall biosynthesis
MIVTRSLRHLCRRLHIDTPVLWFVVPHVAFVLGELHEKLAVYYCIDDYSSLPGVNKEWVKEMDELLTKRADIVFVSAEPLLDSKKHLNPRVVLSRHGVDYDHFNRACSDQVEIAQEVKDLKHPVIGFFGLIESWIDLELVKYIAQSRPNWSILMIGRVAVSENPCEGLANVHFIGSIKYEILPTYAKIFDVAIIPCTIDDLIINFNPLKLREYLAMGKPVVSVRVPEVEAFKEVIEIADDHKDFLSKIDIALAQDTPEKRRKRLDSVKDSSWEHRVNMVVEAVDNVIKLK